jgi:S-DNA-T family DNA segregation ATPase FtsK/SpoIIIE
VNPKVRQELTGVAALLVGLFLGLTLLPWRTTGQVGLAVGGFLWHMFGVGAVVIPLLGIGWALAAFDRLGSVSTVRAAALGAGLIVIAPYSVAIVAGVHLIPADYTLWTGRERLVGMVPAWIAGDVHAAVGTAGGILAGLFALSALGIVTIGWHPLTVLRGGKRDAGTGERGKGTGEWAEPKRESKRAASVAPPTSPPVPSPQSPVPKSRKVKPTPPPRPAPPPPEGVLLPPPELLTALSQDELDPGTAEIDAMGQRLVATLETFGVSGTLADRTIGPVVTRYELEPGPGVKVQRIAGLADDLALAMKARSLRIVAPIPGKARVGIEVPNPRARIVTIRELIDNARFREGRRILPVALGRDLEGQEVYDDLAKMPHLLIAGATGSGKSVCINTIITSLIYSYPPDRLQMLMVDPKMVELSMYGDLPHLRMPVVTSHHKAATVLKWAVGEMERRYRLLHANHARNVGDFNKKVEEKKALKGPRETLATQAGLQKELPLDGEYTEGVLPYIVVIVDELADLMLTVQGEIETPLASLAQKARAIGIHLLLATQRPSVNVITGLIKANFPCRIAFRVSAKVDSRTILDQNGAETMLGNGDMLFLPPGKSEPMRVQGAYISTEETERIIDWYRARKAADATAGVRAAMEQQIAAIEAAEAAERGGGSGEPGDIGDRDTLFRQAAEVCIQNQLGSTSLLQRRMSIGYGRAARIIDQLELAGILGPANGSKPRDVLIGLEDLDEICGS